VPTQYAYMRMRDTVLISLELYRALPKGTVLQDDHGDQFQKGQGRLREEPDFRYAGTDKITWVGFPARADDPTSREVFLAQYRDK
jgi:hypothetical protein